MLKRFFIDLDGTILGKKSILSGRNKAAFQQLVNSGVKTTIATGRNPKSAISFCTQLNLLNTYNHLIAFNGAVVVDLFNQKTIYEKKIEINQAKDLIQFLVEKKWFFIAYTTKSAFGNCSKLFANLVSKNMNVEVTKVNDNSFITNQDFYKIVAWKKINYLTKKHINKLFAKYGSDLEMVFTDWRVLEITQKNVSKKTAADFLIKLTKDTYQNCASIGDNQNDEELMKNVAHSFSLKNSRKTTKKIAKTIVSSNYNDGFSEAVEIFLNQK